MDFFGLLESFNTLLLVTQNEDVTDANEWTGVINTIKAFYRQGTKNINKKIDANQEEMKAEVKDVKAEIKDVKANQEEMKAMMSQILAKMQ